ncbi:Protein csh3 [Lachnellula occidentalis]|uniref:Protein csh3 n=1 Tax=Lachnellula occidentalis TaxID=215460 RepID=A0A8H8UAJ0_9HELO|nr:Protein csh3 [Lachnellula occidentalis]
MTSTSSLAENCRSSSPIKRYTPSLMSRGKSMKTPILKALMGSPSKVDLVHSLAEYEQQPSLYRSKPVKAIPEYDEQQPSIYRSKPSPVPSGPTMSPKHDHSRESTSTKSSLGSISSPMDFRVLAKSEPVTPVDQSTRVDSRGASPNSTPGLNRYDSWGTSFSQPSYPFPSTSSAATARLPSSASSTPAIKTYVVLKDSKSATKSSAKPPTPRVPSSTRAQIDGTLDEKEEDDAQVGLGIRMQKPYKPRKVERSSADSREEAKSRRSQADSVEEYTEVKDDFDSVLHQYRNSHEEEDEGVSSSSFRRDPIPAGDTIDIIDELLEDNYRGQAETFNSISNRVTLWGSSLRHKPPASYITPTRSGRSDINENLKTSQSHQRSASQQNTVNREFIDYRYQYQYQYQYSHGTARRTPSGRTIIEAYRETSASGLSPALPPGTPHHTYGHRIYQVPADSPIIVKRQHRQAPPTRAQRGLFYFTEHENTAIQEEVNTKHYSCGKHEHCTDCRETAYSFLENKAMPTSMPPEERQKVINNNRSLRNIKNELENLAEAGAISDDIFDQIMGVLPSESSLGGSSRANTHAAPSPSPVPTNAFQNMHVADPAPPSYTNTNTNPAPPSLPTRKASTPSKPEIARATALYRYAEPDDCNFEVGDEIVIYEYMNADWWLGKNVRTGKEGVFPVTYVQTMSSPAAPNSHYGDEKNRGYQGYQGMAQQQSQGPPPPGPSNPYNSAVPPMQIAEQPSEKEPGKGGAMGKKFGKKLGNAAIFGAGATIGGNIVNSIF